MNTATNTGNLRPVRIRNLILLVGSMMTVIAPAIISPALPAIETTFASTPNVALLSRLTLTMPALMIALIAPFAGYLLDRIGRRPVIISALLLYGVAGTAGYFLDTLPAILFSRALLGVAIAGTMSGFTTLIGDFFTGSALDRFMGLQAMGNSIGGLVFLVLGGLLADINWRAPFFVYGISFLVLPLFWWYVSEPERTDQPTASTAVNAPTNVPWRLIIILYTTALLGMLLFYVVPVQLPFLLSEMGVGGTSVGLAIGLMALLSAVTAGQYQKIHARFSHPVICTLVFGLMAIGYAIIALDRSFAIILIGLVVGGMGLGPMLPNVNVWLVNRTPAGVRGRLVSGLSAAMFFGQFMSPIAAQPIVNRSGPSGVFVFSAAVLTGLAMAFWLIRRWLARMDLL